MKHLSLFGAELTASQITDELKALDAKFADMTGNEHWTSVYAQEMVSKFA